MSIETIKTLGVAGNGTMGSGIMQVAAQAGLRVIGWGREEGSGDAALKTIDRMLRIATRRAGLSEEDAARARENISNTTNLEDLRDCDFVIESIVENLEAKRAIFAQLEGLVRPDVVIATNTSSLSIKDIAANIESRSRVCGLHFFNPVPMMELVEVVRAEATDDSTIEQATALAERIGKHPIHAQDIPGFIVNFTLMPLLLHAARVFERGLATKEDIDCGMKLGCGHPKGPLALLDEIGIDTALSVAETISAAYPGEKQFEPPQIIKDLVAAGKLGKKNGEGFYTYRARK